VIVEQAGTRIGGDDVEAETLARPDAPRGLTPVVGYYEDVVAGDVRAAMPILFSAVGLVLLISSANAANCPRGLPFDVQPLDPASLIGSAVLLVGISLLASYFPAPLATRLDPIATLRTN
jgi:hypothetical protein